MTHYTDHEKEVVMAKEEMTYQEYADDISRRAALDLRRAWLRTCVDTSRILGRRLTSLEWQTLTNAFQLALSQVKICRPGDEQATFSVLYQLPAGHTRPEDLKTGNEVRTGPCGPETGPGSMGWDDDPPLLEM